MDLIKFQETSTFCSRWNGYDFTRTFYDFIKTIFKYQLMMVFLLFFPFQVRTLFVSGLPMDAKPRELYLLFRAYEVS